MYDMYIENQLNYSDETRTAQGRMRDECDCAD